MRVVPCQTYAGKEGKEDIKMKGASYKLTVLLFAVVVASFAGLTYAAGPQTDRVVTPNGSSGSLPWLNAVYVAGQGPTFDLANWWYRPYRFYSYAPSYYSYSYPYSYGYRYPYFRRHYRHFRPYRFHRVY